MYKIAGVEPEEREILFQNTAFRKGMRCLKQLMQE